ncbi:MAG TPA: hypothetical protein PLR99_04600 [Polyangiaceae bacterium]|jgi:HEPN domain-containing protein|nr:hypothetical protein [Polyangiaceae bacterium]
MSPTFVRDEGHWLYRFSASEWIRAAQAELGRAERAYASGDGRGGLAGARRAAGMALNGALVVAPAPSWGRTYVEHLVALRREPAVPEAVREAAGVLVDATPPGPRLVVLRTKGTTERVVEAARDVIAHAFTVICRAEPLS